MFSRFGKEEMFDQSSARYFRPKMYITKSIAPTNRDYVHGSAWLRELSATAINGAHIRII